ncbi:MAG TPA: phytanoyl-CoA dioxygenase family protein [Acidimicrobiales bacterium]|nr:phytanoyl-CoA dioxygenase family protein [Acidimicrobiales bacterium]
MSPRTGSLLDGEVERFHRHGFVVLEDAFTNAELEELRREADRILRLSVNSSLANRRRHPRLDAVIDDTGNLRVRKIQPVNDLSEKIAAFSMHPRLIDPMRQLMGDEPVLMEEKLNYKQWVDLQGSDFSFLRRSFIEHFVLHHDWGYYRQQGYPDSTLSSALAIDDCAGKGPIRVIPGSHLIDAPLKDPDPASGSGEVVVDTFDGARRVALDVDAGSMVIFHSKLVHDSEPNPTREPRRMMIYSHYPRSFDPDVDPDRRNGPTRTYSRQFEDRYLKMLEAGEFEDLDVP